MLPTNSKATSIDSDDNLYSDEEDTRENEYNDYLNTTKAPSIDSDDDLYSDEEDTLENEYNDYLNSSKASRTVR